MVRPRGGSIKREPNRNAAPRSVMVIDDDQRPEAPNASRSDDSSATLNASDGGEGASKYRPMLFGLVI